MTFVACCVSGGVAYAAPLLIFGYAAAFFMVFLFIAGWQVTWSRLAYVDHATKGVTSGQLVKATFVIVLLPLSLVVGAAVGLILTFPFAYFLPEVANSLPLFPVCIAGGVGLGFLGYLVLRMTFAESLFKKRPAPYDR